MIVEIESRGGFEFSGSRPLRLLGAPRRTTRWKNNRARDNRNVHHCNCIVQPEGPFARYLHGAARCAIPRLRGATRNKAPQKRADSLFCGLYFPFVMAEATIDDGRAESLRSITNNPRRLLALVNVGVPIGAPRTVRCS